MPWNHRHAVEPPPCRGTTTIERRIYPERRLTAGSNSALGSALHRHSGAHELRAPRSASKADLHANHVERLKGDDHLIVLMEVRVLDLHALLTLRVIPAPLSCLKGRTMQ